MAEGSSSRVHTGLDAFSAAIKRHVLVFGAPGKGKTTIANMLQNNSSALEACLGPGKVGHGAGAGTTTSHVTVMPERQLMVHETTGMCNAYMSNEGIVQTLRTINSSKIGLSCVIVVSSMGRWSKEERMNIELLDTLFEKAWTKQSILVLTHYEGNLEDKEEEIRKWCGGDPEVKNILSKFARIIVTDNDVRKRCEVYTRPLRANCLKELNEQIARWDATATIRPI